MSVVSCGSSLVRSRRIGCGGDMGLTAGRGRAVRRSCQLQTVDEIDSNKREGNFRLATKGG